MSNVNQNGARSGFLPFVVGALVVAVAVLGYFLFNEQQGDSVELKIEVPNLSSGNSE